MRPRKLLVLFGCALMLALLLTARRGLATPTLGGVTVHFNVSGSAVNALATGEQASLSLGFNQPLIFTNGSGNGQADSVYSDQRTLSSAANEDLSFNAGSQSDAFGNALALTKVKLLVIYALAANTTNLTVSPSATNGFTGPFGGTSPTQTIQPGGYWVVAAPNTGYTVDSTHKQLNILNGTGASATYKIVALGV